MQAPLSTKQGYLLGLLAYVLWGLFPLFFKNLEAVPAIEVIAHRVLWSAIGAGLLLLIWKHPHWWQELRQHPKRIGVLALSGLLIACNWLLYVWAVNHDRMVEASLGYYINPLVNVLLGMLFLGERLRKTEWFAMGFAALGVAIQVWQLGALPWVSLVLAFSFGFYGLLRKQAPVDALPGLAIETWLLIPITVAWLVFYPNSSHQGLSFFSQAETFWLIAAGPVTLIPLICFNMAARTIPYASLAFLQYIAPTLVLLQAIFIYNEQFSTTSMLAFGCIWVALVIYSFDLWRTFKRNQRALAPAKK